MASLPKGRAARGKAGIFGGSISPLQYYLQQGANRDRQRAMQAQEQKKERDLFISDIEKHSPAKVRDPFFEEIQNKAQQIRNKSYALLDQGYNKEAITRMVGKDWGDLDIDVSRANMKMDTFDQYRKEFNDNKKYYKPEAETALNDIWFENNRARPIAEINTDAARPAVFENPEFFNMNNIAIDFMKSLPEKVNQYYTEMWNPLGQQYNVQETKTKLGFQYMKNPSTGQDEVVIDERTGQPKITMTPDVYIQAMQNPYLSKAVEKDLPNGSIEEKKQYLTSILEGYDPKDIKNRPQLGFKENQEDRRYYIFGKGGYGYRFPEADLKDRDDILDRAVLGQGTDVLSYFGQATKDVKASYGKDKEGKFIQVSYPSTNPEFEAKPQEEIDKMSEAEQAAYYASRYATKQIKTSKYYINNADQQRAAKIALSQRMDEIDKKRSLGEDYIRYVDDKRKSRKKLAADDL